MTMDELDKNAAMLKKLVTKEMASLKRQGINPKNSKVNLSRSIAVTYAEQTQSRFETIFPLVSAMIEASLSKS